MLPDLSKIHYLISDLFKWPSSEEEWKQYELTEEQVDQFNSDGFLSGVKLLNDQQIERLQTELTAIADPDHRGNQLFYEFHSNESTDPATILFHALGAWRITEGLHDVLWNPAFLVPASQLLGGVPVRFWHDQIFWKPPKQGGVVAWHQDYSYWTRTKPVAHLTCWCGLDEAQIEKFVQPCFASLKAGEAVFHHSLTLHGSGANKSSKPRRAFVINVIADGVVSDSNEVLLEGVPVIEKGEKIEGQFFPLLFDPQIHFPQSR